jgi:hypothetical protein
MRGVRRCRCCMSVYDRLMRPSAGRTGVQMDSVDAHATPYSDTRPPSRLQTCLLHVHRRLATNTDPTSRPVRLSGPSPVGGRVPPG